ncbi:hypothetical protein ACPCDX_28985 [Streptomyces koyangensis]|uniref:hypothetical protein n=1 Tax=Streptomyces koyangensis TaxID=188770 RepID=UPI003C2C28C1
MSSLMEEFRAFIEEADRAHSEQATVLAVVIPAMTRLIARANDLASENALLQEAVNNRPSWSQAYNQSALVVESVLDQMKDPEPVQRHLLAEVVATFRRVALEADADERRIDAVQATRSEPTAHPTRPGELTASERQFLTFALDLAFDRMVSEDGFTEDDHAALAKLQRMAAAPTSD